MSSGEVNKKRVFEADGRITEAGLAASNATLVDPPAVAIGLAGQGKTRGTAALVNTRLCTNQSVALIKGRTGVLDTAYLFHNLDGRYDELRTRSAGGGRAGLSRELLAAVPIALPDLSEQSRIAAVMDTLDEAIAKTATMVAKLQKSRAGLLHDLLTRGLDKHGQLRDPIAHPEQFQDSPVGSIPREWEVLPVECVGEVRLGRQRSPAHENGQYIRPYLRVANVFDGFIDYSDVLKMNFELSEQEIYGLKPGDILLNEGQSLELVGRSAIFQGPAGVYCFQNTLVRFRCRETAIPEFCQAVFKYWLDTRRFIQIAKQTTSVAHLGADRFAMMPFARPKVDEQKRIASSLQIQFEQIQVEEQNLTKLQQVKSGLTNDLLTGRVRVPEAQKGIK